MGYIEAHCAAQESLAAGERQSQCVHCMLWFWKSDADEHRNGGKQ